MNAGHRIESREAALKYMLGGNAVFTVVSRNSGARYTYRVSQGRGAAVEHLHFASVLTGPDNGSDYVFFGTVFTDGKFRFSKKARGVSADAPSVLGFQWLVHYGLRSDVAFSQCEFWHHGRCSMCGQMLTDPASIARGLGPKCAAK